jgi:flagellar biosynthetic protein FliR
MVAVVMLPAVPPAWHAAAAGIRTMPDLLFAVLNEILLGAAVALVMNLCIGVCVIGGELAGWGTSLLVAQSFDPVRGANNAILAQIIQMVFIVILLISNAHLAVLRMMGASFAAVPPSLDWLNGGLIQSIIGVGSFMYEWGVRFAFPVLAGVLIIDACLGLIARMAPEFDILFLSFPIRLLSGIVILGFMIRYGGDFFARLMEMMLRFCARLLSV